MQTRPFANSGVSLPIIGQGTWYMERDEDPVGALRRGLDLGLTHIDTAEMYGSGAVERIVGEAVQGRREEVYLVSKVLPSNASRNGTVKACERSLKQLNTDYLDLYLLHWPGHHPLGETLEAFESLTQTGKIRGFGVSNFDVEDLEELMSATEPDRIVCNQVLYHPNERTAEGRVLPWCREHGIAMVAYSPLGHGSLPGSNSEGGRIMGEIASERGVTTSQVALQFVTRHADVFAIPKASDVHHVKDNACAGEWCLSKKETERLERALPKPRGGGLPML